VASYKTQTSKFSVYLLGISIVIFSISALVYVYLNFFSSGFKNEILSNREIGILLSSYENDKLVQSCLVTLYPSRKKAGIYFINPLLVFSDSGPSLEKSGKDADGIIEKEIEALTETTIHHSIRINHSAFVRIINILGGMEFYTDPYTHRESSLYKRQQGEYVMSGEDLLDYISFIQENTPLEYIHRISRQQSVLLTAYDFLQKNPLEKPVLEVIHSLLETSISKDDFFALYQFVQSSHIVFSLSEVPAEPSVIPYTTEIVFRINPETVKTAWDNFKKEIISDRYLDGEKARIEVLNFTETNGLARKATVILHDRRMKVLSSANGWNTSLEQSIVLDRSGNPEYTYKTGNFLEIPKTRHSIRKDIGMDTTVLLGEDFARRYKQE